MLVAGVDVRSLPARFAPSFPRRAVVGLGIVMATAIAAMLLVEWTTTGILAAAPIAVFALIALGSLATGLRVYGSIADEPPGERLAAAVGRGAAASGAQAPSPSTSLARRTSWAAASMPRPSAK